MAKVWLLVRGQKQDQHHWDQFPCTISVFYLSTGGTSSSPAPLWGLPTKRLISPKSCGFLQQTHDTEPQTTSSLLTSHKMCIRGVWCSVHKTEVKGSISYYRSPGPASLLVYIFVRKNQGCFYICEWKGSNRSACEVVFLSPPTDSVLDSSQGRKAIANSPAVRTGTCSTRDFSSTWWKWWESVFLKPPSKLIAASRGLCKSMLSHTDPRAHASWWLQYRACVWGAL